MGLVRAKLLFSNVKCRRFKIKMDILPFFFLSCVMRAKMIRRDIFCLFLAQHISNICQKLFCFLTAFNRTVCVPCTVLLYRLTPEALHTPFLPVPFQMFPFDFLSICHSFSLSFSLTKSIASPFAISYCSVSSKLRMIMMR